MGGWVGGWVVVVGVMFAFVVRLGRWLIVWVVGRDGRSSGWLVVWVVGVVVVVVVRFAFDLGVVGRDGGPIGGAGGGVGGGGVGGWC